jgi:hypothetical protein
MSRLITRINAAIGRMTGWIRTRRAKGLKSPVAVQNRRDARKRVVTLREKIRSLRIDWNGYPPIKGRTLRRCVRIAARQGLVVTSTTGGSHTPGSFHYSGRAVDMAGTVAQMKKAQTAIAKEIGTENIAELFGPHPWFIDNGARSRTADGGPFPGHGDHIHIAI